MRERKFRAWDEDNKKMWLPEDPEFQNNWHMFPRGNHSMYQCYSDSYLTIMQYTGLKDKNGVEIYEKDLLQTLPKFQFVVNFINGKFQAFGKWDDGMSSIGIDLSSDFEIIGNIYENPELWETK